MDCVLGWLRQEENQYSSCPSTVARTLPRDLQKLAGYTIVAYALGYVDELCDPTLGGSGAISRCQNWAPWT